MPADPYVELRAFWDKWASLQAEHAWRIYRSGELTPKVEKVVMNAATGVFEVTFAGGDVYVVEPSGMGRVHHRPPHSA